jgi:N,N'-diacetylchitobiose transport system permease protein
VRRRAGWNALGIAVFVVLVFPVYWMVTTAFKQDGEIVGEKPKRAPLHP